MKWKDLVLNPYFTIGLFILMLNDCYLKYEFGNYLTGKLSDFAGLFVFSLFIASVFPSLKNKATIITGIGFIIWKLPLIDPVISLINQLSFVSIARVIDYSDYIALLILPLSHYLINHTDNFSGIKSNRLRMLSKTALLFMSLLAFCATSVPRYIYEMPQGTVYIGESYDIKLSKDSVVSSIKRLGYNCDYRDDFAFFKENFVTDSAQAGKRGYYQSDNVILYLTGIDKKDTIKIDTIANVKYDLQKIKPNRTRLTIINVTLPKKGYIQNWRTLKNVSEQYNEWLRRDLIKKID